MLSDEADTFVRRRAPLVKAPMNVLKYLELAAKVSRLKQDERTYFHGAVGVRRDGAVVASYNGAPKTPQPKAHAEARLIRKLGKYGTLFVVRTLSNGVWANSKPCIHCEKLIKAYSLKCYYSDTNGWSYTE